MFTQIQNVDDILVVELQKVVKKLPTPKNVLRGILQFDVSFQDL